MQRRTQLIGLAAAIAAVATLPAASVEGVPYVPCKQPRKSAATPHAVGASTVHWAFRAATSLHGSVTSGHGSYGGSSTISGAICHNDAGANGRRLALSAVPGRAARLQRGITVAGTLGAQLVLPVRVSGSDDPACPPGAGGTATIFTSYNGVHADRVSLRLKGPCARHNASYHGANVLVAIPH